MANPVCQVNVFCQICFGNVSPTDTATRGLILETLNSDSRMKEAGITIADASFVYHPEKNIEGNLLNGLGGALFSVPEDKLPHMAKIERMEFQGQSGCYLVLFDLTQQDRAQIHRMFGKLFNAGEIGEPVE